MGSLRIQTVAQRDGEVRLMDLPCRKGDRVEAIVSFPDSDKAPERQIARERFLARARASRVCSTETYPSRDELHDRT